MIKRLITYLPLILGLMFVTNSCIVGINDDYNDNPHNNYHDYDWEIEDYLKDGYWYPESHSGLTQCEFDSYFYFNGNSVYFYNCHNERYDSGTYNVFDGYLNIRYKGGDRVRYDVIDWSHNHLVLRADDGVEYYYERHR